MIVYSQCIVSERQSIHPYLTSPFYKNQYAVTTFDHAWQKIPVSAYGKVVGHDVIGHWVVVVNGDLLHPVVIVSAHFGFVRSLQILQKRENPNRLPSLERDWQNQPDPQDACRPTNLVQSACKMDSTIWCRRWSTCPANEQALSTVPERGNGFGLASAFCARSGRAPADRLLVGRLTGGSGQLGANFRPLGWPVETAPAHENRHRHQRADQHREHEHHCQNHTDRHRRLVSWKTKTTNKNRCKMENSLTIHIYIYMCVCVCMYFCERKFKIKHHSYAYTADNDKTTRQRVSSTPTDVCARAYNNRTRGEAFISLLCFFFKNKQFLKNTFQSEEKPSKAKQKMAHRKASVRENEKRKE
ncbi:conserved hypothetical protein [Trichinella spiralis]|uniref:hypothetical protein n=1 Tax=Trichinella spiralis TaxID=6334 RepID=UPI0001EFED3E|nr:conserved hypothetical protein [Trichinella spiralis]